VAIADDEEAVRDVYRTFFANHSEFELVGEASDGRAAVVLYRQVHPDVMLMDLKMPVMSGYDAIKEITCEDPAARVVALTTFGGADHIIGATNAGAVGYLTKDAGSTEFAQALRDAAAGHWPLSFDVRESVMRTLRQYSRGGAGAGVVSLTPRETEVVLWLGRGLLNHQIAAKMGLSEGSVKQYLNRLSDKIGADTRTQIVIKAVKAGLIDLKDV
jgi:DNA-binding NarL/FixJ family response regulator